MSGEKRSADAIGVRLSCPICLDSLGDPGLVLCIITSCRPVVHYICNGCIKQLPVNASGKALCAECRAPVGAIVPLPAALVDGDAAAQTEHGAAVKRLRQSEPGAAALPPPRLAHVVFPVQAALPVPAAAVVPAPPARLAGQDLIPELIADIGIATVQEVVTRRAGPPEYGDVLFIGKERDYARWPDTLSYAEYPRSFRHMVACVNAQFPAYRFTLAQRSMRGNHGGDSNAFFCLEAHTSTVPQSVDDRLGNMMVRFGALRPNLLPTFLEMRTQMAGGNAGVSWEQLRSEHTVVSLGLFLATWAPLLTALLDLASRIMSRATVDLTLGFDTTAFVALLTKEYFGRAKQPTFGQKHDWVASLANLFTDLSFWGRQMRLAVPTLPRLAAEALTPADHNDLRKLQVAITELVPLLVEHRGKVPRTIDKVEVRLTAAALDQEIIDRANVIEV